MRWDLSITLTLFGHLAVIDDLLEELYLAKGAGAESPTYHVWNTILTFLCFRTRSDLGVWPQGRIIRRALDRSANLNPAQAPPEDPEDSESSEDSDGSIDEDGYMPTELDEDNVVNSLQPDLADLFEHPEGDDPLAVLADWTLVFEHERVAEGHGQASTNPVEASASAASLSDSDSDLVPQLSALAVTPQVLTEREKRAKKRSRTPDFLTMRTFRINGVVHRLPHLYFELKIFVMGHEHIWSDDAKAEADEIIYLALPQLFQQAQFIFSSFPDRQTVGGVCISGVWWRYLEFRREDIPKLPPVGRDVPSLLPEAVMALAHWKTLVLPLMEDPHDIEQRDYHHWLRQCWAKGVSHVS